MTIEVVNSPFISWPWINLPASFKPTSDKIPSTNEVHFTKFITKLRFTPNPPMPIIKEHDQLSLNNRVTFHCYHSTSRSI